MERQMWKSDRESYDGDIFIGSDFHGDPARWYAPVFRICTDLKAGDLLLICGDFGYVDKPEYLDDMEMFPFLIGFIPGNHENYPVLHSFPEERWNGGRIRRIRKNVICLMNGQVYEINGKRFFTMGGACSLDREYLPEGRAWWPEEIPSEKEMEEARENLKACNYEVDYILTHAAPIDTVMACLFPRQRIKNLEIEGPLLNFLEEIREKVKYKHWYFGHYHRDENLFRNQTVVYEALIKLEESE